MLDQLPAPHLINLSMIVVADPCPVLHKQAHLRKHTTTHREPSFASDSLRYIIRQKAAVRDLRRGATALCFQPDRGVTAT
jgi:hypothetical protein